MHSARRGPITAATVLVALFALATQSLRAADALAWQQKEEFLLRGKITKVQEAKKGVSGKVGFLRLVD